MKKTAFRHKSTMSLMIKTQKDLEFKRQRNFKGK